VRRIPFAFSAALAAATLALAPPASANGRYPESNHFYFSEADPNFVLLRVTFGLLVSHDRGKTWDWICEAAIGFVGEEDPMYAATPNGALLGTTFQGLAVTRDGACSWDFAKGELEKQVFIDLATSSSDPRNFVAFASSYDKQGDAGILFTSKLWETNDDGKTFQRIGDPLDPKILGYTVDTTETDRQRLYVSAVRDIGATTRRAVLLTSRNRGKTWEELDIGLENGELGVYIAAVDPTNAGRVYLRTAHAPKDRDKPTRLLLVDVDPEAGAAAPRVVYAAQGALLGFALSPDASKVWVGGPRDGVRLASTKDFVFQQKSSIEAQCLAFASDGLWACSNERSGFIAGISTDEGATFAPKLRFCGIRGPLQCAAGTKQAEECAPNWPAQKSLLGCGGDDGGSDGGADAGPAPAPEPPGDCDCRATPTAPWAALGTAFVAIGAAALMRRRRRR
jgi:hypothetical protein